MTISSTPSERSYAGDNVSVTFTIPFVFDSASDLKVIRADASGNTTVLTSGFSVSGGGGSTGSLTLTSALATGFTLTILDDPQRTQDADYIANDDFPAEAHEKALDKGVRLSKRLYQLIKRSIRTADGDPIADLTLGSVDNRKGKYLFFNAITGAIEYAVNIVTTALSQSIIGQLLNPQTPAELAALVTPTNYWYLPFDLRRYGGDPTGVAFSDTALASAIAVCGATGGTIRAPGSNYTFASQINLNQKTSIVIQGDGTTNAGATGATKFTYTGTGTGVWITMNSALGCVFKGIQLVHSSASFTGTYIKCSNDGTHGDPSYCGIHDCTLGANVGAGTVHLDLDKCILFTADRCEFSRGNPSVRGQATAGSSYSNVIRFRDCMWQANYVAPVQNGGQAWTFDGCTFEPLTTGAPGALLSSNSGTVFTGLTIRGCWFGDATATVGPWLDIYTAGFSLNGNYISGNVLGSTGITLRQSSAVSAKGNVFDHLLVGINFAAANCVDIDISPNDFLTVTTPMLNANNVPTGSLVWGPNFGIGAAPPGTNHGVNGTNGYEVNALTGMIRQWGTAVVTTGTPLAVTFPLNPFPNAVYGVRFGMAPAGTANTVFITVLPTTAGFTISVQGTAGTNTVYWEANGF